MLISSLITEGARTPLFTGNNQYDSTGISYGRDVDKITEKGETNMFCQGQITRNEFLNKNFIPVEYKPSSVFVRGPYENPSVLSGYSYVMGMYPETVEGVDLMSGLTDLDYIPITNDEVDQVRFDVDGGKPTCGDQRLDYYPGNDDREYLIKPFEIYKGQSDKMNSQMYDAQKEFEGEYGTKLYDNLAKAMNKDSKDINFGNTIKYLDDYISAKANGKDVPYDLDDETQDLIGKYYAYYYKRGLFRNENLNRVFTDSYFTNLAQELQLKIENIQEDKYEDQFINDLKTSIHISDQQTYLAVLHQIGDQSDYVPKFGQKIDWELIDKSGEYFVKASQNGEPLSLEGNADSDGIVHIDIMFEYLCSKLYYGDTDLVAKGIEDPDNYQDVTIHCATYLNHKVTKEEYILLRPLYEFDLDPDTPCDYTITASTNYTNCTTESIPTEILSVPVETVSSSPPTTTSNYSVPSESVGGGFAPDGSWSSTNNDYSDHYNYTAPVSPEAQPTNVTNTTTNQTNDSTPNTTYTQSTEPTQQTSEPVQNTSEPVQNTSQPIQQTNETVEPKSDLASRTYYNPEPVPSNMNYYKEPTYETSQPNYYQQPTYQENQPYYYQPPTNYYQPEQQYVQEQEKPFYMTTPLNYYSNEQEEIVPVQQEVPQEPFQEPVQEVYQPPQEPVYQPPQQPVYQPPPQQYYQPPPQQYYQPPPQQYYQPPVQQYYQPPVQQQYIPEPQVEESLEEEHVIVEEAIAPASILKRLVEISPTYDEEERSKINTPSASVTYVEPSSFDYYASDRLYIEGGDYEDYPSTAYAPQQALQYSAPASSQYVKPQASYQYITQSPSTVQPSSVQYSYSQPSSTQYSYSQPSSTQYSYSQPSSTQYSYSQPASTQYSYSQPSSSQYSSTQTPTVQQSSTQIPSNQTSSSQIVSQPSTTYQPSSTTTYQPSSTTYQPSTAYQSSSTSYQPSTTNQTYTTTYKPSTTNQTSTTYQPTRTYTTTNQTSTTYQPSSTYQSSSSTIQPSSSYQSLTPSSTRTSTSTSSQPTSTYSSSNESVLMPEESLSSKPSTTTSTTSTRTYPSSTTSTSSGTNSHKKPQQSKYLTYKYRHHPTPTTK